MLRNVPAVCCFVPENCMNVCVQDFVVDLTVERNCDQSFHFAAMRDNSMVLARIEVNKFLIPSLAVSDSSTPSALAVLVDTSASRLLGFERQLRAIWGALETFKGLLPTNAKLLLIAFDQEIEIIHDGVGLARLPETQNQQRL